MIGSIGNFLLCVIVPDENACFMFMSFIIVGKSRANFFSNIVSRYLKTSGVYSRGRVPGEARLPILPFACVGAGSLNKIFFSTNLVGFYGQADGRKSSKF